MGLDGRANPFAGMAGKVRNVRNVRTARSGNRIADVMVGGSPVRVRISQNRVYLPGRKAVQGRMSLGGNKVMLSLLLPSKGTTKPSRR
jgi:hypothetical protein